MNIELYIANRLCDLEKSDLSIRLKRQFINPSELNTKDAQKSYTISLPSTPTNDEIFRYSNVEETEGKFSIYPDARLYVNNILILEGKFRLTEITRDSYKGNLGVPAPLTAKDVFGEMKMNEAGEWLVEDWQRQESISKLNKEKNSPIIFPLAMYKLFNRKDVGFSGYKKDLWDQNVNLRMNDIPASINCLEMLKKIFSNSKYTLTGNAFDDERLKSLYTSYKNPNEHKINWDVRSTLKLKGSWTLADDYNGIESESQEKSDQQAYISNIFEGKNHELDTQYTEDKEGLIKETTNGIQIVIPKSGLYKIYFMLDFIHGGVSTERRGKYKLGTGHFRSWGHSSEIHLVKKKQKDLKDYDFLFDPAKAIYIQDEEKEGENPNPIGNGAPFFVQESDFVCGYSVGKRDFKPDNVSKDFRWRSPANPLILEGSAAKSSGYKNKHKIELNKDTGIIKLENDNYIRGEINQIAWLDKGDILGLIDISTLHDKETLYQHSITYTIDIQPFKKEKEWLTQNINAENNSKTPFDWYSKETYHENEIEIMQFLPSEVTINDWIVNFCKAFNLKLSHIGDQKFSLDLKDIDTTKNTSLLINLDEKVNINHKQNDSLNLPMQYEIEFSINNSERGYIMTSEKEEDSQKIIPNTGKNGKGVRKTNSHNNNILKHNSFFSYCWYKPIEGINTPIPIITDNEIWKEEKTDYKEVMDKTYFNLSQRFWFKDSNKTFTTKLDNIPTDLALVSNTYKGDKTLELNYEDKPNSIMRNYFMLLTNERNYTSVECYLSPEEYADLGNSYIKFNGDLYIVAEADGYDPMGKTKTKLKLIKKM